MDTTYPDVPSVPNNLPSQPTLFIGRETELRAARALLLREGVRLVTLTGPGGTGKTRLSLELASSLLLSDDARWATSPELAKDGPGTEATQNSELKIQSSELTPHSVFFIPHFPDGVYFVPLASITDPALVATGIAKAVGIMEVGEKDRPLIETLKAHLRAKQLLLLLDNFEQVLGATPLVVELLEAAPQVKALVTSRERLHLRGEREFPVPPMRVPSTEYRVPSGDDPLRAYESVRLFVERAASLLPDFDLDEENAPAVAEICARLDGLPLAIELAAARIKILTPQAMLPRLKHRLKLLTGGERNLPPRHRTLRAAIEWSYDLLDDADKALFRSLSIFSGSFSLEAAEAIAEQAAASSEQLSSESSVLDIIASLVDKNLLRRDVGDPGDSRFAMLETIHEYARERLEESGEAGELRRLHALYFLSMAESIEPELKGPKQVERLRQLEDEHDNLRAALKWALDSGESDMALSLASALHGFWRMHGHLTEGRAWLESALDGAGGKPTSHRARALMAVGTLASSQSDFARARSALEESLAIFRELGDKESVASTLRNLGNELRYRGDLEGSWRALEEALAIARELDKEWDVASLLGDLGIAAQALGNDSTARRMYEESLALRREMGDTRGIAMMLVNLGELARAAGSYEQAGDLYTEALALARELGDKWGVGMVLHNLGHVAFNRRDYIHAWNLFAESLGIFHELRNKRDIAYCLAAMGGLFGAYKQPERAAVLFSAAQALSNTISSHLDPADQVEYERNLAEAQEQLSQGDWDRAWVRGQTLTLDEAVAFALQTPPSREQTSPLATLPRSIGTAPLVLTTAPLAEPGSKLTEREEEVLGLVAEGLADAQIAERLQISPRTVHRHLSSIYSKLGVTSRTAALRAVGARKGD